jgi:hypothetical protein
LCSRPNTTIAKGLRVMNGTDRGLAVAAPLPADDWLPIDVGERAPISARLLTLLKATQLDRQLVAGTAPEPGSILALHVTRLAGAPERQRLAARLRQLVIEARCHPGCWSSRIAKDRTDVVCAAGLIDRVAMHLNAHRPVSARGVARLRLLLTDGAEYGSGDLCDELQAVLELL